MPMEPSSKEPSDSLALFSKAANPFLMFATSFPLIRDSRAFPEGGIIGEIGGGNTPIGVEGDPHNPSTQGPERPIDANPSNQPGQGEGRQAPDHRDQNPQPPEDNNYGEEDDRDGQMAPAPPPAEQIDPNQDNPGVGRGAGQNPGLGQGQGGGNFNPPGGGYG